MDPCGILDENTYESLSLATSSAVQEFERMFVFFSGVKNKKILFFFFNFEG